MAQLVHELPNRTDARRIICRRLGSVLTEPALKLANGNPEQVGESLLWGGEDLGRPGKYVANGRIIVVRLIFSNVTQCVAKLLQRNANLAPPVCIVIVAQRFFRAIRGSP